MPENEPISKKVRSKADVNWRRSSAFFSETNCSPFYNNNYGEIGNIICQVVLVQSLAKLETAGSKLQQIVICSFASCSVLNVVHFLCCVCARTSFSVKQGYIVDTHGSQNAWLAQHLFGLGQSARTRTHAQVIICADCSGCFLSFIFVLCAKEKHSFILQVIRHL